MQTKVGKDRPMIRLLSENRCRTRRGNTIGMDHDIDRTVVLRRYWMASFGGLILATNLIVVLSTFPLTRSPLPLGSTTASVLHANLGRSNTLALGIEIARIRAARSGHPVVIDISIPETARSRQVRCIGFTP